ncbi:putative membrane protein [Lysobacter antibioticus]|uniref:DUF1453 domain-containing protein n=1 Tax=Lysobacter antibioticus TaxID=84531 RepID=A0A0S2DXD0_LYSAN|nr:hypothetical protein [Lysobacter antibioticus]ALN63206.1 putative membrane protein [Lysobacter antibioticus]ALN82512.1 hypothetical protein LA76x_4402 [Lysobacter antibioticus]
MPLLLLIPLALLVLLMLWAVLLPLGLIQRYRYGKARRRALPWAVRLAAALSLLSLLIFFVSAWLVGYWIVDAPLYAALGWGAGLLLGVLGVCLTRFEYEAQGLYYTPNRWLILGLTLVVAARIVFGLWQAAHGWSDHASWLPRQGSLLAVGGLLLGYYQAYSLGLGRRLRRRG